LKKRVHYHKILIYVIKEVLFTSISVEEATRQLHCIDIGHFGPDKDV